MAKGREWAEYDRGFRIASFMLERMWASKENPPRDVIDALPDDLADEVEDFSDG